MGSLHGQVIKGLCNFLGGRLLSHHPAKFGSHKHYGNGDVFNLSRDFS